MKIPVHTPVFGGREIEYVNEALRAGEVSGSCGRFITEFERAFAHYCGCAYGIAVSSGSTALHLAAILAGIKPGDEVLMSAFTNIASANAVVAQGGVVVPVDSEPETWNLDISLLDDLVTDKTRAIMPVHIYGHPVNMRAVMRVAKEHRLFVIEDCAEAHGAVYYGHSVGSFGDMGCFSFYANKIITCGEGGMLVTNNQDLADRARSLRNLAFTTPRFKHDEIGYNYRMTNLEAAIGLAQFERIDEILAVKRSLARRYTERLAFISGLQLPIERVFTENVYWMYCIVVKPNFGISRDDLMRVLSEHDIETRTMFCPMNLQPALLKRDAVKPISCPVAENLWMNGLYLPSGCSLTDDDLDWICDVIKCA